MAPDAQFYFSENIATYSMPLLYHTSTFHKCQDDVRYCSQGPVGRIGYHGFNIFSIQSYIKNLIVGINNQDVNMLIEM